MPDPRFRLLQVRDAGDAMAGHEHAAFADRLGVSGDAVVPFDLLGGELTFNDLGGCDGVLVGGSGDYSAAGHGPWLDRALDSLRTAIASGLPVFASCWGHQALARALGGTCETVIERQELGTPTVSLTPAGRDDPLFAASPGWEPLPTDFRAVAGHEDSVTALPPGAVLLARSKACEVQAYRLPDRPVYATQFHPELGRDGLLERITRYPKYVERIAGVPFDTFAARTRETPEVVTLLRRWRESYISD